MTIYRSVMRMRCAWDDVARDPPPAPSSECSGERRQADAQHASETHFSSSSSFSTGGALRIRSARRPTPNVPSSVQAGVVMRAG